MLTTWAEEDVMDLGELHRRTVEGWEARVAGVAPGDFGRATPCRDWDVRALISHVVGEDLWTTPIAQGRTIEEVGDRFDGDLLGDDAYTAARDAAHGAITAIAEHLPSHGMVHLSFGEVPIDEYVWQVATDHLVHTWDLASATGQDRAMDPDVVAAVSTWFADREEMYRGAGVIGPRQEAGSDDPHARLLAGFGRDPAWHDGSPGE